MTDWKALAKAREVPWDEQAAARQSALMESLEAAFLTLVAEIPPDMEPSPVFRPEKGTQPQ
jgi:hypothetical protein